MIEVSRTLPVNDGEVPELSEKEVWEGLVEKAANPLPYVHSITECNVIERVDGVHLIRDIIHVGKPVRESVTFYPRRRVHYVRTRGEARGIIDNLIGYGDDGGLELTFKFYITIDGIEDGSDEEHEFAKNMEADYLDAVRTTLAACRDRLRTQPPAARDVLDSVDAKDVETFGSYFAPTGRITFGNNDPLVGRDMVVKGTGDFLGTIGGIQHTIVNEWSAGTDTTVELSVKYTRKDGESVTIPVVSIWTVGSDGLITDYRVFFDVAPVFA